MTNLPATLYLVGFFSAYRAGSTFCQTHPSQAGSQSRRAILVVPPGTLLLVLAVLVPTTLQFFYPRMLSFFQRDASNFFEGEWWRLLTPLFIQDGGLRGAIFNLASLLLMGSVAEKLWGYRRVVGIFLAGGIVGEIAGMFWQPLGAGNSVGTFSLAASVAVACLTRHPSRAEQVVSLLAFGAFTALLALRDIHGAAAMAGGALALVLSRFPTNHRQVQQKDRV